MSDTPNDDEVICPNCCHQFRAIPVNVQRELAEKEAALKKAEAERDALRDLQLTVQSREAEEARFYRYLRDEAGQLPDDHDGPMICAGLGDNFDFLRGEECDIAIRAAIEARR